MPTTNFTELLVWKKAHEFVLLVYAYTNKFPNEEKFGLTSQFRRAAVSIAANIAEGYKKVGLPDKAKFLNISQGSIEECQYYLILAKDLHYGENEHLSQLLVEVSKMLDSYRSKILNSIHK